MNHKPYFDLLYRDFAKTEEYSKFSKSIGLIEPASKMNIALCGSTAIHIASKKPPKVPSDIDFVTDSNDAAIKFIAWCFLNFEKYRWYGNVQIQHKTNFCFEGTLCHYKLKTSFGTNVCIMVSTEPVNRWRTEYGLCIQKFDDVVSWAKKAQEKDHKKRLEII